MKAFLRAEMTHRGVSEAQARQVPPFGGPIYAASVAAPTPCGPGQGVAPDGTTLWTGGSARYVYLLEEGSANPGVPPNLDLPDGTLWRLDTRANARPLQSGLAYGSVPAGSLQRVPADEAPELQPGRRYQLVALLDVGLPVTSCVFTFGEEVAVPQPTPETSGDDAGAASEGALPDDACAADPGFGEMCIDDADCGCAGASYCAIMPGQSAGTCTATGCLEDPSVCPAGWSCFDISIFAPGQPSICTSP